MPWYNCLLYLLNSTTEKTIATCVLLEVYYITDSKFTRFTFFSNSELSNTFIMLKLSKCNSFRDKARALFIGLIH